VTPGEVVLLEEFVAVLEPGDKRLHTSCVQCETALAEGDAIIECPRCHRLHHVRCWKNRGGCAAYGCPQTAKAVKGEKPSGDGPPPPLDRRWFFAGGVIIAVLIAAVLLWPQAPDPAMGRQRIAFMTEAGGAEQAALLRLQEQFNEHHPELYLDLQLLPYGGMEIKLVVSMGAGEAPDILGLRRERMQALADQGALHNLGTDEEPAWGMPYPGRPDWKLCIFVEPEDLQRTKEVLDFLLENLSATDNADRPRYNHEPVLQSQTKAMGPG